MKTTKLLPGMLGVATLAFTLCACGASQGTGNNNAGANASNQSNNAAANANRAAAGNAASASNTAAAATPAALRGDGSFKGEYLVGDVKCTVTMDDNEVRHEIKCADQGKAQIYFRDDTHEQAIIVSEDQKSRFVFDDKTLTKGSFTDEKGKTVKVTRIGK